MTARAAARCVFGGGRLGKEEGPGGGTRDALGSVLAGRAYFFVLVCGGERASKRKVVECRT